MSKTGKRFKEAQSKIDRTRDYTADEALALVKDTAGLKFDATIEVHMHLGINPKKAEQIVRSTVLYPHSVGKKRRIAVFTTSDKEQEAKTAGAEVVGGEELVKEIQKTGKCDFDLAIATPDFMKTLAPIARTLGQKGLMPNPKNETITTNLAKTIKELLGGKQTFRSDDTGNVHAIIGKASMPIEQLKDNYATFLGAVKKAKPQDMKGTYLRSVTVASTMGPGIRVKV